ncbi:geminin isoform X2 [Hemicordylus capensis]|uniref:geminin isoform X2 n=1 Tax=Hemicordylus capensis TaxID=884348 RepID=UPI0023038CF3|nr:geminin isoform X2 [Hemicordylus capensis]XP_053106711.1 geminin isoform X2 [Hemicordylus capensis]
MNSRMKQKLEAEESSTVKGSTSNASSTFQRQTLKMIQPSITGCLVGRINKQTKSSIKRKLWSDPPISKASKPEVAVETEYRNTTGVIQASDLTVKGNPSSRYWKELAEERRKALYEVLQENEKLHKEIELKDGEIACLKEENEELAELAGHVQYMANMIERLTGQAPESLETLKNLDLEEIANEDEESDSTEEDLDCDSKEQSSQLFSNSTQNVTDLLTNETSNQ